MCQELIDIAFRINQLTLIYKVPVVIDCLTPKPYPLIRLFYFERIYEYEKMALIVFTIKHTNLSTYSRAGLFLRTSLSESLNIFHDFAMGETAATETQRRWNAEGAGMPPLPNHRKNKGRRHQSEENKATP